MLEIRCPFCGPRPECEFRYGGESHIVRPGPHDEVDAEAWAHYLYHRSNPRGLHKERWLHWAGCRSWFNIVRDTADHAIHAVYAMGAAAPDDLGKDSAR